jgi:hypothetical protein
MFIEQSDQSRECAPQLREYLTDVFPEQFCEAHFSVTAEPLQTVADHRPGIPVVALRRGAVNGTVVDVNELRALRRAADFVATTVGRLA